MFCFHCGTELEDGCLVCPECGTHLLADSPVRHKKKISLDPLAMVALTLSILSAVFGFILITVSLALGRGIAYAEYIAILPAFVGLGLSVYKFFAADSKEQTKLISAISMGASFFVLIYAFIGFLVFIT